MLTDDICRDTIYVSRDDISSVDISGGGIMKKSEPMSESYFYILLCLAAGPNHGYGIMQMTEKLTGGEVTIGSGTMYGATGNMIKKGWIRETISAGSGLDRKRLYQLTGAGREALDAEIARLDRMLKNAEEVRR